jgi:hypothetical protein
MTTLTKREILTKLKNNLVSYIQSEIYNGPELNELKNMTPDNFAILLKLKLLPLQEQQRVQIIEQNIPNTIVVKPEHREKVSEYMTALIEVVSS